MLSCIQPTCENRHKVTVEGVCQICDPHKVILDDVTKCVKPTCELLQKILADGTCSDCPSHTSPSEDHVTCVAE
jgi:hypothetical protein